MNTNELCRSVFLILFLSFHVEMLAGEASDAAGACCNLELQIDARTGHGVDLELNRLDTSNGSCGQSGTQLVSLSDASLLWLPLHPSLTFQTH